MHRRFAHAAVHFLHNCTTEGAFSYAPLPPNALGALLYFCVLCTRVVHDTHSHDDARVCAMECPCFVAPQVELSACVRFCSRMRERERQRARTRCMYDCLTTLHSLHSFAMAGNGATIVPHYRRRWRRRRCTQTTKTTITQWRFGKYRLRFFCSPSTPGAKQPPKSHTTSNKT